MFSKEEVDSLVANSLAELRVEDFKKEADFRDTLRNSLEKNSDAALWAWSCEDRYRTSGLHNEGAISFDISGVYAKSCKVQIELKYVITPSLKIPPKNFPAFSYDLLKDCIKIELAMSGLGNTRSLAVDLPVVYGLSIGITNYPAFWEEMKKGKNGWSRNSLECLRKCSAGFQIVETVAKSKDQLNNSIFRNKRYHLSFALNWSIAWNEPASSWRYVTISPDAIIRRAKHNFFYSHEVADGSYIPFLNLPAKNDSKVSAKEILVKAEELRSSKGRSAVSNDRFSYEHDQVLSHWKNVNPDRLLARADSIIKNANRGDMEALGQSIRKFHNFLGYQAWGAIEDGGKCAGCLYRSGAFIGLDPTDRRSREEDGHPATIHLEHLIPVVTMRGKIVELVAGGATREQILRFVLRNSIAVGVHREQRDGNDALVRPGLHAHSHVFTGDHEDKGFPFRRYRDLEEPAHQIFNIQTGERVDFQTYTLEQARADLIRLVKDSVNEKGLLEWLED